MRLIGIVVGDTIEEVLERHESQFRESGIVQLMDPTNDYIFMAFHANIFSLLPNMTGK